MLEARDTYVAGRHNELAVLERANLRQFLETARIEQTTFGDLSAFLTQKDVVFDQGLGPREPWNPASSHFWLGGKVPQTSIGLTSLRA
jgi:hypothetical protein